MTFTSKQILQLARNLITDPKCFTRRALARDKYGTIVRSTDKDAVCFCIYGAVERTLYDNQDSCGTSQSMPLASKSTKH